MTASGASVAVGLPAGQSTTGAEADHYRAEIRVFGSDDHNTRPHFCHHALSRLSEPTRHIILGELMQRIHEDLLSRADLNKVPEVEICRSLGHSGSLLK